MRKLEQARERPPDRMTVTLILAERWCVDDRQEMRRELSRDEKPIMGHDALISTLSYTRTPSWLESGHAGHRDGRKRAALTKWRISLVLV